MFLTTIPEDRPPQVWKTSYDAQQYAIEQLS